MGRKKAVIMLSIVAVILATLYWLAQGRNDAKTVFHVPSEFALLKDTAFSSGDALCYVFWENQISFLDSQGECLYQTSIKNDDFIVKYRGEYYISNGKYDELLQIAKTGNKTGGDK